MSEAPPPSDEEVTYVGAWFGDLAKGETYELDRWAPFVRTVISWVGREAGWLRHPRPLFDGMSRRSEVWFDRFDRAHVEGLFVEVPRQLAGRLTHALQVSLSARDVLQIEQVDRDEFERHSLGVSAWLVGDVCVPLGRREGSDLHDETGLRIAYPSEGEAGGAFLNVSRRTEAEHVLRGIVARGVYEPKSPSAPPITPAPIEILVVRATQSTGESKWIVPAYVAVFDVRAPGGRPRTAEGPTPPAFEEHIFDTISQQLVRRAYRSEVIVWTWTGSAANHPQATWLAITASGPQRPGRFGTLFKDLGRGWIEGGDGELRADARPLLRWRPDEGLTRFWTALPPPDTLLSAGKHTANLRHRVAHVVRAVDEPLDLRVDALDLDHVRNQEAVSLRFAPGFNVIVGENARGKTTILEALTAVLRVVVAPKDQGELLREADVTERYIQHGDATTVERQYPATLSAFVRQRGREGTRERLTRDDHGARREGAMGAFMERLTEQVRKGLRMDLPLVRYYGVTRSHQPTDVQPLDVASPSSRLSGYAGALDGSLNPLPFQRWFKTMELAALQERRPSQLLEVVRDAVRRCIEDCDTVEYLVARDEVVMRLSGARTVPFRQLSDGYRLTLAMVADIAWRCVTLNPHLGPAATQETSGVVLVDELDLHLHPRWQRHVVGDLRRAFPRLQFIVTTHSPFIVQSMKPEEVLSLDDPAVRMNYQASSIEDIAEEAMGVEGVQRSRRFLEMEQAAEEYYRLLETKPADDEQALRLKARLDELMLPFADNPAYVALLRVQRAARGLG